MLYVITYNPKNNIINMFIHHYILIIYVIIEYYYYYLFRNHFSFMKHFIYIFDIKYNLFFENLLY